MTIGALLVGMNLWSMSSDGTFIPKALGAGIACLILGAVLFAVPGSVDLPIFVLDPRERTATALSALAALEPVEQVAWIGGGVVAILLAIGIVGAIPTEPLWAR